MSARNRFQPWFRESITIQEIMRREDERRKWSDPERRNRALFKGGDLKIVDWSTIVDMTDTPPTLRVVTGKVVP